MIRSATGLRLCLVVAIMALVALCGCKQEHPETRSSGEEGAEEGPREPEGESQKDPSDESASGGEEGGGDEGSDPDDGDANAEEAANWGKDLERPVDCRWDKANVAIAEEVCASVDWEAGDCDEQRLLADGKAVTFMVTEAQVQATAYVAIKLDDAWWMSVIGDATPTAEAHSGQELSVDRVDFEDYDGDGNDEIRVVWSSRIWEGDPDTGEQQRRYLQAEAVAVVDEGTPRWVAAIPASLVVTDGSIPGMDTGDEQRPRRYKASIDWEADGTKTFTPKSQGMLYARTKHAYGELGAVCPALLPGAAGVEEPGGTPDKDGEDSDTTAKGKMTRSKLVDDLPDPDAFCRQMLDHNPMDDETWCTPGMSGLKEGPDSLTDEGPFEEVQVFSAGNADFAATHLAVQSDINDKWYFLPNVVREEPRNENYPWSIRSERLEVVNLLEPAAAVPAVEPEVLVWEYAVDKPRFDGTASSERWLQVCDVQRDDGAICHRVLVGVTKTATDGSTAEARLEWELDGQTLKLTAADGNDAELAKRLPEGQSYTLYDD